MREIPITKGMFVIIDDEIYDEVSKYKWHAHYNGTRYYASRNSLINGKWRQLLLHRFVIGAKPGQIVDHINRNTLDCRKSNLRICTCSQNLVNSQKSSNRTSVYKGVSVKMYKGIKYWQSKIQSDGKTTFIGIYDDEISAAHAYNIEAKRIFGEYAVINDIPDNFSPSPKRKHDFSKMRRGRHGMYIKSDE